MADQATDLISPKANKSDLFIVGIGASAGGVETLSTFFENVPADSGLAYVVILHLSPDYDSNLANILQNVSRIPVLQVREKVKIERDHIYVVSPNSHLVMEDGHIVPSLNMEVEDRRAPVDILFRTLAESHGAHAIAVILSGTGANGSMGIKRVKERGGATFVQNPREALFNEMPRNSIATELIDEVLNVADMPARLISYRDGIGNVEIPIVPEQRAEEQQQALSEIFLQVRLRTGHDFTNYKRATILRRLERRINIRNLLDLRSYAAYVNEHPDESTALLKDLLISVTNFFRDKSAFEYIETEVLPKIYGTKKEGDSLRIWVVGCATGEEAYSLAMLCAERSLGIMNSPKIQIFATDIDEDAIATAREGMYTLNDAADVSPERLRRFFTKEGDEYRIRREIRETILFASHNILKDPPFSHIDIITCRNMLIYLNGTAQERVMETFHFALNPAGYLFLGNSESADGATDLYAISSREFRVYQSRSAGVRTYPVPDSIPSFKSAVPKSVSQLPEEKPAAERISYGDLHQQLLEAYAPPSVVINIEYDILHLSESAGRYLKIVGGEPSRNLLMLIREELRLELRSALYQAANKQVNTTTGNHSLYINGKEETVSINVRPVLRSSLDTARGFFLVVFEPGVKNLSETEYVSTVTDTVSRQLEDELLNTRHQLRTASEQYELQAEEMKASNEELQALNEELRSAAEELETSKEELQSINEELRTVNQELKVKIDETSIASNNLQNFINSTDIGTIFLDRSLRVNFFTPAARQAYNVIPSDYGRALADITSKIENDSVLQDAEIVLSTLQPLEKEAVMANGQTYLMRITPYRTSEDRINGVVISFINITERKTADKALRISEERFRAFVTASSDALYSMSPNWSKMYSLKGMDFLADTNDANHNWMQSYIPAAERSRVQETISDAIREKKVFQLDHQVYLADHAIGWTRSTAVPMLNEKGDIVEWIGAAFDITEQKETEERLHASEEAYRISLEAEVAARTIELKQSRDQYYFLVENSTDIISRWSKGLKLMYANSAFEGRLGKVGDDMVGKDYSEIINIDGDADFSYMDGLRTAFETGEIIEYFNTYSLPSGEVQYFSRMVPEKDEAGEVRTVLVTGRDISLLKKAQEELIQLKDALAQRATDKYVDLFNAIDEGFCIIELMFDEEKRPYDYLFIEANAAFIEHTGLKDPVGKTMNELVPGYEQHWFDNFGNIATTGNAARFEGEAKLLGHFYDVYAFRAGNEGENRVAVLFTNISRRKREERAKAFILKLSDELRPLDDAANIQRLVAGLTINYFDSERVYYCEFNNEVATIRHDAVKQGITSVAGIYPFKDYPFFKKMMNDGNTLAIVDTNNTTVIDEDLRKLCVQTGVISFINVPVIKDGVSVGCLCITQSTPRRWDNSEIGLAEEIAGRTWDAVERAKTESKLRESEERLRLATTAANIYSWEYDVVANKYSFSENAANILGVSELPLTPEDTLTLVHPEDKDLLETELQSSVADKKGFAIDFRSVKEDGSIVWLSVQTTMMLDITGNPFRLIGIAQDISERKEAEEALQYSETKLRIVMKASGIGTWMWNLEENNFEPDQPTLDIFGNPPGGLPGIASVASLLHPSDMSPFADAIEKAADTEGKGLLNVESRIVKQDGSLSWIANTGQTFFEGNPKKAVVMVGSSTDITERKIAEEILQQSEERYRAIVSQATAVVSEMDVDGNLTLVNNTFCQSLGYTTAEMLEMNICDFTHPDDIGNCLATFKRTVETGVSYTNEKRLIRSDGSVIWIAETISAIKDEKGKTKSILAVGIDSTERKKTEIFIHESEKRYRIALEAGELATWDWNLNTDKVEWNEQHFKLFGVTAERQTVDPEYFLEFIYPEDIALVKQQLAEVVGPKGIYSAEFRIRRKDNGNLKWMTGYGRVTERDGDKPIRVSGVMFDSTERRESENNLEATKNSLNTALEAAKMGVWSVDLTHGYMDRSAKHDQLLGYNDWQEEWNHDKAKQFITDDDKAKYDEAYKNLLENGVFNLEARIKNLDGSVCWVHYFGRSFRNEDAKGETAAGVIFDITDQKTIEKQKDEFIGIASHELKTPVTSIKAYAEILQEMFEEAQDTKSAELMRKLDSQVDRLSKLIRDLLDVTKVSEGQLHLVTRPFNLETVLKNTAEEMQRTTRSHTIRLSIPAMPEIIGDEERISQVLINMMSNAIKYSPGAREIFVTAKNEEGIISVSVQDFGIGMSPGTLEKLFARFFRSDNPSVRSFPGLGLGLFISMEIMKRHGGTIAVQSEKGKGSVFTMVLPLT